LAFGAGATQAGRIAMTEDEAFAALRGDDARLARRAEAALWELWHRAGDPDVDALLRRGIVALQQGELAEAERLFDLVIARAPRFAEGWNKRATVRYLAKSYRGSIEDCREPLARNPRDFRVVWTGQLVSLVGTWMQSVAQSWLVLQLSDSALKLGLIGTFQFAPVLLFSVVAGALADRLPKRRLILATQTALCLQALALTALVWPGHVRYWHVAVLALLLGCANVIDMPTRKAFV